MGDLAGPGRACPAILYGQSKLITSPPALFRWLPGRRIDAVGKEPRRCRPRTGVFPPARMFAAGRRPSIAIDLVLCSSACKGSSGPSFCSPGASCVELLGRVRENMLPPAGMMAAGRRCCGLPDYRNWRHWTSEWESPPRASVLLVPSVIENDGAALADAEPSHVRHLRT